MDHIPQHISAPCVSWLLLPPLPQVAVSGMFRTLRDMVGENYISPASLDKIEELGQGGYATIELCK